MHSKILPKKVSIIILNYNGWRDTIECLESLKHIKYTDYDVIIVDNGSDDDSTIKIIEYYKNKFKQKSSKTHYQNHEIKLFYDSSQTNEKKFILIENKKNYGFAEGNNIGIQYAIKHLDPDYLLLLNNDTIVEANFLIKTINHGEKNKNCGILGPAIYNYKNKDIISSIGGKVNWKKGEVELFDQGLKVPNKKDLELDFVEGCALIIKKDVLKKIGFLDSNYFCYWEDVDLCIRTKKSNYNIVCVKNAKIWHKGSETVTKVSGFYEYYMTRNMFWFIKKHSKMLNYTLFLLYFLIYKIWIRFGVIIYNRNYKVLIPFLKGIKDGIKSEN